MMISAEQIKAARAWMGWTRDLLAIEAGVSPSTIRNLEQGMMSFRSVQPVRLAFENKGFKFIGKHGLSRELGETKTISGPDSCEEFYEELLAVAKARGGEVAALFKTQQGFACALGVRDPARAERLQELAKHCVIKCLLSGDRQASFDIPSVQFRATSSNPLGPLAQVVFAETIAVVVCSEREHFFHITRSIETANMGMNDFAVRWESAVPLLPLVGAAG